MGENDKTAPANRRPAKTTKHRRIGVSSDSRICAILAEFDGADATGGSDVTCYDRGVSSLFSR